MLRGCRCRSGYNPAILDVFGPVLVTYTAEGPLGAGGRRRVRSPLDEAEAARLIEDLWPQHHCHLVRHAYRLLENRQDADDAVGDVWLAVFTHLTSGKECPRDWRPWLTKVTLHKALGLARRRRQRQESAFEPDLDTAGGDPSFHGAHARHLFQQVKAAAMKRLSYQDRAVVGLFADGYSDAEIAQFVGLRESTISTKRSRAVGKLHRITLQFDPDRPVPDAHSSR